MLKIRRYQASDHNEVWNLHNLALDQVGANAGSGAQDNDLHAIKETYIANKDEFWQDSAKRNWLQWVPCNEFQMTRQKLKGCAFILIFKDEDLVRRF